MIHGGDFWMFMLQWDLNGRGERIREVVVVSKDTITLKHELLNERKSISPEMI
jgi:hypothetical protein